MGPTVKVSSCFSVTAIEYLPVVPALAIDPPGRFTVTCNGIPVHHFAQRAHRGRLRGLAPPARLHGLEERKRLDQTVSMDRRSRTEEPAEAFHHRWRGRRSRCRRHLRFQRAARKRDDEVQLYAFDILAMGSDDLRSLPLHLRKMNLERLLARRPDGVTVAPFERGEIGPESPPGGLPHEP